MDTQNVSIPTMEYYSTIKRREALTLTTTWMDLENTMLSGRSQTQKDTQCVIPLMGNVQNRQIHRHREWVCGCQGLGREEWGADCSRGWGFFWGDGMFRIKWW